MDAIDKIFIAEAKAEIAEDNAGEVIEDLLDFLKPQLNTKFLDEIILHSAGYKRLTKKERQGTLTGEQVSVQRNQINQRILGFLNELYRKSRKKENPIASPATDVEINDKAGVEFEKLVSKNGLNKISWLKGGMEAAKSVCYIEVGREVGTGFMLRDGWILTNHHVLATEAAAASAKVFFNYEETTDGQFLTRHEYSLDASTYKSSPMLELDYALVRVNEKEGNPKLQDWGYLEPSSASPAPDDYVTIIQHPRGQSKQLATDMIKKKDEKRLYYRANTEGGSSGSPVFDKDWKVVALHHAAAKNEPLNQGILISKIMDDLGDLADFFI